MRSADTRRAAGAACAHPVGPEPAPRRPPDRLAKIVDRPSRTLLADDDVVEVGATGLAVREDGPARFHQPLGLASPASVLRRLGDRHVGLGRRVAESVTPLHVPVGTGEEVLDLLPRRELALVILERPDHGLAPCGRDVRVLRERPDARDQLGIAAGVERERAGFPRALAAAASGKPGAARVSPVSAGAHLVREWNGRIYRVEVLDGGYCFDGKTYPSLTAIARRITGANWSGPRFFGLTRRRA